MSAHCQGVRVIVRLFVLVVAMTFAPAPAVAADPVPGPCLLGRLPHGALSLICTPTSGWNGDLVVFAHGYVACNAPLGV